MNRKGTNRITAPDRTTRHPTAARTRTTTTKSLSSFRIHFFILLLVLPCNLGFVIRQPLEVAAASRKNRMMDDDEAIQEMSLRNQESTALPKLVVFDLDGCLWRPEMYELLYMMGGVGAPFTPCPKEEGVLLTDDGKPVRLLGNVRDVMRELYTDPKWKDVTVSISSKTDQPTWARELLSKFQVDADTSPFVLQDVLNGPLEIRQDSKVQHFKRLAQATGFAMEEMLFFDNERWNCIDVAELGVVSVYCPENGVTTEIWKAALEAFPTRKGEVVGL